MPATDKPVLYIITNNHFDLTWRRCWERPFINEGRKFISYADLEEFYLLDNLDLARKHPHYKFEAECTYVLRKFLERHADRAAELKSLYNQGRFRVTGGGEAIIDGNIVHGESLVRNYVDGLLWVEQTLGQKTGLAVRNDAFGNPAQLPQILRGVEIPWATGMSYSPAEGRFWRGLDGSTVFVQSLPTAAMGGGNTKYSPCVECEGTGAVGEAVCPVCRGRGIDPSRRAWLPGQVREEALEAYGAGRVEMGPEELLPNPEIIAWARQASQDYNARFAIEEELRPYIQGWLDQVDQPPEAELHPGVELNPNNSGVLVTRIATKQTVRRQEYALLGCEALGVMAALSCLPRGAWEMNPAQALKLVRHQQFFTMFHDAITATHIDPAYDELLDYYRIIDAELEAAQAETLEKLMQQEPGAISVINPYGEAITQPVTMKLDAPGGLVAEDGQPVKVLSVKTSGEAGSVVEFLAEGVPPFSAKRYRIAGDRTKAGVEAVKETVIENGRFRVEGDDHGLLSIFDKQLKAAICAQAEYRPGELILEHDEGSPWATLSDDQRRTPLASVTTHVSTERAERWQRMTFAIDAPREAGFSGKALRGVLSVRLLEGDDKIHFHLDCWWDAFDHRLRVAFPTPFKGRHMYEVPYGVLERTPYHPSFRWAGANGDWPALNWAGVEGEQSSVAVFNRGTPSYKIEPDDHGETILVSLLRAPTLPTYLHEPEFYTMTDYNGMRDMGNHSFDLALAAYATPFDRSSVVTDGEAYNARLVAANGTAEVAPLPRVARGPARIAALKWSEDGAGYVLRLVEFRGRGGEAAISVPAPFKKVERANLLERQGQALKVQDGEARVTLRPWEITTIKVTL